MTSAHVYIGTSLDGFIARTNGDIDWLMKFADADAVEAYNEFMAAIDVIVIDGRAREACLAVAAPRLKLDGLIVFDNSHRARYERAISASGLRERRLPGLTPTLPYPDRTSLLFRLDREPDSDASAGPGRPVEVPR